MKRFDNSASVPAAARPRAPRVVAVKQGYRLWAGTYDRELNPLLALEERTLLPLLPGLEGKLVLDLACGTGRWLKLLLERGARAGAGIDISWPMLRQAGAKASLRGRLVRAECLALPLRSQIADFVICSFALGHMPAPARFAAEVARVMKRQGDLYLTDLHPDAYRRGWRTGFRNKTGPHEVITFPRPLDSILQAFEMQGFELAQTLQPRFSDMEKPIFDQAGKRPIFETACRMPAVLACHFKRK